MGPSGMGEGGGTWDDVKLGCFFIAGGRGLGAGGVMCTTTGDAALAPVCVGTAVMMGFGGACGGGGAGTGGGGGGGGEAAAA